MVLLAFNQVCHFSGSCLRDASNLGDPALCQSQPRAATAQLNNGEIPFPTQRGGRSGTQRAALHLSSKHHSPIHHHALPEPISIPTISGATGALRSSQGAQGELLCANSATGWVDEV